MSPLRTPHRVPGRARPPSGEPGLSSALRLRADCGENKARCPRAGNSARRLGRPRLCPGCWLTSRPRCRKRVSPAAVGGGFCEPGRCGWRVPAVAAASARRVAGAVVSPCAPSPLPPTNACLRSVRSLRQDRGLSAGAAGPRFPGHTPGRSRNGPLPWGSAGAGRRATRSGRATARGDGASRAFRAVHTGD